ncbi:MAG: family 10 glycosylhydrolase [bacterium]|nr:MAG: family 10 glycosylhydrolase [bacterium]
MKGLWVVRHNMTSAARIDSLLKVARHCGITDLFVQVRGRGDAFYNSKIEPRAEEISDSLFDPLNYILQATIGDTVRIHAWLNVFYVWSKDTLPKHANHIVNNQQHWLARSIHQANPADQNPITIKDPKIEGLFVSPLQPEAQNHFLSILEDIVHNYGVAGIHLDYIRYPDQRFDVHPDVIQGFRKRYILNPEQFLTNPELFAQKFSVAGYEVFYYHWRRYLLDGLSDFVRRISDTLNTEANHILLSAAVKPDIVQAHWNYFQDWDRWVREEWLDFAVPMNYTPDERIFRDNLAQYLREMTSEKYAVGIALYNQPEEKAIRQIAQVEAINNLGFVLFSYDQLVKMKRLQKYLKNLK